MKNENQLWKTFQEVMTESRNTTSQTWEMYKTLSVQNILSIIDAIRNASYKARIEGYNEGQEDYRKNYGIKEIEFTE